MHMFKIPLLFQCTVVQLLVASIYECDYLLKEICFEIQSFKSEQSHSGLLY